MTFEPTQQQLSFVLPDSYRNAELILTNPASTQEYVRIPIQQDARVRRVVSTAQLGRGTWRAQLNWTQGRQHYCHERIIVVR